MEGGCPAPIAASPSAAVERVRRVGTPAACNTGTLARDHGPKRIS